MSRVVSFIALAGWLALVAGASADIVWSGEKNISLGLGPVEYFYSLDINSDGTGDFTFRNNDIRMFFEPRVGNAGLSILGDNYDPITAGIPIGPDIVEPYSWRNDERLLVGYIIYGSPEPTERVGPFYDTDAFLGASFQVADETHYGWIHLVHDNEGVEPLSLTIQDWAWETQADTPIIVGAIPEPSSGILTMVGTLSLLQLARSRRRRRKQTHKPTLGYSRSKVPEEPEGW
jgi:hypothetical protein